MLFWQLQALIPSQIQQLMQVAQMQFDTTVSCVSTLWVVSELTGATKRSTIAPHLLWCTTTRKKIRRFLKPQAIKKMFLLRMRGKDLLSTVIFLRCLPALTALLFRSLRLKSVPTCPTLATLASLVLLQRH